jgi:hypothetical protein
MVGLYNFFVTVIGPTSNLKTLPYSISFFIIV